MTPADLEAIRDVIRDELRRCGIRPPLPSDFGAYRWDAETDTWRPSSAPQPGGDRDGEEGSRSRPGPAST